MYKYQNGCLPILFSLIGGIVIVISVMNLTFSVMALISSVLAQNKFIEPLLLVIMFTMGIFFGFVLIGFFPEIQVSDEGILVRYIFGLIKVRIYWKEIVDFLPHHFFRKIMIIAFKREGYSIFKPKTLIFNAIYGLWAGVFLPVLLLYKTSDYDDLYLEINKRINSLKK